MQGGKVEWIAVTKELQSVSAFLLNNMKTAKTSVI